MSALASKNMRMRFLTFSAVSIIQIYTFHIGASSRNRKTKRKLNMQDRPYPKFKPGSDIQYRLHPET